MEFPHGTGTDPDSDTADNLLSAEFNDIGIGDLFDAFERSIDGFGVGPDSGMDDADPLGGGDPGDSGDLAVEDVLGAASWLLDPVDHGGGIVDDGEVVSVPLQDHLHRSLDLGAQSTLPALRYGAAESRRRDARLRRLNPPEVQELLADYFAEDDTRLALAYSMRRVVMDALHEKDAWSLEWIFGNDGLEREDLPARSITLELFEARDLVFQTRVQYQMWLEGWSCEMRFPTPGLHRRFVMKLNGILHEYDLSSHVMQASTIMEQIWRNPGVSDARLWELCINRGLFTNEHDLEVQALVLQLLAEDYLISRHDRTHGWYFTGTNPVRMLQDLRLSRPGLNGASVNRAWSQWW